MDNVPLEERKHQENLEFILKHGVDITNGDPDDAPKDEFLIPEEYHREWGNQRA